MIFEIIGFHLVLLSNPSNSKKTHSIFNDQLNVFYILYRSNFFTILRELKSKILLNTCSFAALFPSIVFVCI